MKTKFNEFNENNDTGYFSLTRKYEEFEDELLCLTTNIEEWLKNTPNHMKLLSLLAFAIDAEISERFELDDTLFDALENEYKYAGFELTRDEVTDGVYKLKEEGYLK